MKEPAGLLPGSDDRPADVLIPFWTNGQDSTLDVTVVNPLQAGLVVRASQEGQSAVESAHYAGKVRKPKERCPNEGITFTPLHNAYIEQLDSSVYNIELYTILSYHMGRERVFSEKKSPITSVKLFGMEKVSGITKKNFKIGTLEDFEKTYVLYVAMAEKPLSSGQKWFLR